jgi:peptidyl-tRNA hydrolase, PTH1 family
MIKLIIGLGNIGDTYANTRHNVAWWFLEQMQEKYYAQIPWQKQTKLHGLTSKVKQGCILLKPSTYMNLSGISVAAVCQFYKFSANSILVVHDELDLPAGVVKLKYGGSGGGHNGLKSIDQQLGTNKYWRLRIGIGHPRNSILPTIQQQSVADYVLHNASKEDIRLIQKAFEHAFNYLDLIIKGDMDAAMNGLHTL